MSKVGESSLLIIVIDISQVDDIGAHKERQYHHVPTVNEVPSIRRSKWSQALVHIAQNTRVEPVSRGTNHAIPIGMQWCANHVVSLLPSGGGRRSDDVPGRFLNKYYIDIARFRQNSQCSLDVSVITIHILTENSHLTPNLLPVRWCRSRYKGGF